MRHEDKIPLIGRLRGPHIFIGMLLGPLALKLSSTGYRFARLLCARERQRPQEDQEGDHHTRNGSASGGIPGAEGDSS
jgi:hypothetical protein